jgi:hypothetical protein
VDRNQETKANLASASQCPKMMHAFNGRFLSTTPNHYAKQGAHHVPQQNQTHPREAEVGFFED